MKASLLCLLAAAAPLAVAETLVVDDQVQVRQSNVERPARGATMRAVQARFGEPAGRQGPVGSPAITRWDYPGFSVYFENDHVVHAVATAP